ncbi:hypothetical protein XU18_0190 [Perkinsela sp. CCAP 1560/4]|nr:hypothetical protein XU18_0190 [Perkinsela sp. CCAP 1560/4]|eukprot:KNH09505.1 hypothetical protein XU18_0190 [Perkinsela sp. CCAP 1560/4]
MLYSELAKSRASEVSVETISEHLSLLHTAWSKGSTPDGGSKSEFKDLPGSFHRSRLVNLLLQFDRNGTQKNDSQTNCQSFELATLLARLATAESLGEAVARADILKKRAGDGKRNTDLAKNIQETLSTTLNHIAHRYFLHKPPIPHKSKESSDSPMKYIKPDMSSNFGHYKRILDVSTQFMHDAMMNQSLTLICWLNHFALLEMGNADEYAGSIAFDMWLSSFSNWLEMHREKIMIRHGIYGNDIFSSVEINQILNATAICMIGWCEKSQNMRRTMEAKRMAKIWALFDKISFSIYDEKHCFHPNIHLFAKVFGAIRWTKETGGLRSHLFHRMRTAVSFDTIINAPWRVLSKLITTMPLQNALMLCMLRFQAETQSKSSNDSPQLLEYASMPYHLVHCMLSLFVQNHCIAESEYIFRANVQPQAPHKTHYRKHKRCATLTEARYHLAEDKETQREHMILLILNLYANLPVPDLQSALEIVRAYVPEDELTREHYSLLIRCASNDPEVANALYIEACSRGIGLDRRAYDGLYFSLGKSTRYITQSVYSEYSEMNAPELDSYLSIPALPAQNMEGET